VRQQLRPRRAWSYGNFRATREIFAHSI